MLEAGFSSLSLSSSSSTSHCSSPAQNKSLSVAVVKTMLGLDVHYSTLMIGNQLLTTKVFKTPWLMHALVCQTSSWYWAHLLFLTSQTRSSCLNGCSHSTNLWANASLWYRGFTCQQKPFFLKCSRNGNEPAWFIQSHTKLQQYL